MKKINLELVNGDKAVLVEDQKVKILKSENYNFLFDKSNGFFARWGKTQEDDGDFSIGFLKLQILKFQQFVQVFTNPVNSVTNQTHQQVNI